MRRLSRPVRPAEIRMEVDADDDFAFYEALDEILPVGPGPGPRPAPPVETKAEDYLGLVFNDPAPQVDPFAPPPVDPAEEKELQRQAQIFADTQKAKADEDLAAYAKRVNDERDRADREIAEQKRQQEEQRRQQEEQRQKFILQQQMQLKQQQEQLKQQQEASRAAELLRKQQEEIKRKQEEDDAKKAAELQKAEERRKKEEDDRRKEEEINQRAARKLANEQEAKRKRDAELKRKQEEMDRAAALQLAAQEKLRRQEEEAFNRKMRQQHQSSTFIIPKTKSEPTTPVPIIPTTPIPAQALPSVPKLEQKTPPPPPASRPLPPAAVQHSKVIKTDSTAPLPPAPPAQPTKTELPIKQRQIVPIVIEDSPGPAAKKEEPPVQIKRPVVPLPSPAPIKIEPYTHQAISQSAVIVVKTDDAAPIPVAPALEKSATPEPEDIDLEEHDEEEKLDELEKPESVGEDKIILKRNTQFDRVVAERQAARLNYKTNRTIDTNDYNVVARDLAREYRFLTNEQHQQISEFAFDNALAEDPFNNHDPKTLTAEQWNERTRIFKTKVIPLAKLNYFTMMERFYAGQSKSDKFLSENHKARFMNDYRRISVQRQMLQDRIGAAASLAVTTHEYSASQSSAEQKGISVKKTLSSKKASVVVTKTEPTVIGKKRRSETDFAESALKKLKLTSEEEESKKEPEKEETEQTEATVETKAEKVSKRKAKKRRSVEAAKEEKRVKRNPAKTPSSLPEATDAIKVVERSNIPRRVDFRSFSGLDIPFLEYTQFWKYVFDNYIDRWVQLSPNGKRWVKQFKLWNITGFKTNFNNKKAQYEMYLKYAKLFRGGQPENLMHLYKEFKSL